MQASPSSVSRRCVVCDLPEPFEAHYEAGDFALVRCPRCGLIFQDPVPSADNLDGLYYQDEELARRLDSDLRGFTLLRGRQKLALLRSAGVYPGGDLLDVGCSSGAWLEVARDAGWRGEGVELGDPFVARARAKGLTVHGGTLEGAVQGPLRGRSFGLITLWDVLEHLPDPLGALEIARELLAPGGILAITAPNVEGLYPKLTYRLFARPTGVWEHPELPAHIYDFSPRTASVLLARARLETLFAITTSVPFHYYRATSLERQLGSRGKKALALRSAFEGLRVVVYPWARMIDRGNAFFMTARARVTAQPGG